MKTISQYIVKIVIISSIFLSLNSYAQAPQKMSYQAVLRNAANTLISNAPVAIRVSILQGSATGTAVYVERHTLTTNLNGLATFEIGAGTPISGSFAGINWATGLYFVKTETDPSGGTNYTISGTSQLLSVPYALYAKTAGTTTGGTGTETDPVWTAAAANYYTKNNMQTSGSAQLHFNNLANKPTTLAGYGITDAMSTSAAANGITANNVTNWNAAFSWGNHAGLYRPITYVPGWNEITNKPVLDGSETKVTAGTNVTVTGAGTTASPYVINSTGTSGTPSAQWTTTGNNISNTNTGNVGIGTTNPVPFYGSGKTLTVASSGTGDTFGANLVLTSNSTSNSGQIGAITFAQPDITSPEKRIGVIYTNLDNAPSGTSLNPRGQMGFGIATGAGNQTAMIIDSDQSLKVKNLKIDNDVFGSTPNAPLQFGNSGGRKIVLYEGANNDHQYYGFAINSGVLRYQVEAATNNHIFYAGSSATTSKELMRIQGNGNVGIGISDPAYKLDIASRMRIRSVTGETAGVWLNNDANNASPAFMGMLADDKVGFYGTGAGWGVTMNTASGNVGVGTEAPSAKLEVNGFTKLGSDAPAIKVKKFTGTTAGTEGGAVSFIHSIPLAKIVSVSVLVITLALIPPSYTQQAGYEYNYYVNGQFVTITNKTFNSAEIRSKPFIVLVTYEE